MSWRLKATFSCRDKFNEYTHAETVQVVNGIAIVKTLTAKQYLLCLGYELLPDEEPVESTLPEVTEE